MAKRRGEIVKVGTLFEKYKNTLIAPQKTVETEALRVIGEMVGIKLNEDQVSYTVSAKILYINSSSLVKQEIVFHKEKILSELVKNLGQKNSPQNIL
ncbi:MAG: hypothetical protein R3B60_01150 [Candidatus Paceibacterota bacterium]